MNLEEQKKMIEQHKNLVFSCARRIGESVITDDDAIQCGMIGLWEACKKWDKKYDFVPFAEKCIRCNIIDYLRRKKEDDPLEEDIPCPEPEEQSADVAQILAWANACFPKRSREIKVLKALLAGKSKDSVARKMGVSRRTVHRIAVKAWRAIEAQKQKE